MASDGFDRRVAGGLGLAALMLIAAGVIFFLEEIQRKAADPFPVVALLPEARRVQPGTAVWIAGSEVGAVRRVRVLEPGVENSRVAALVEVPAEHAHLLRRDSRARLTTPRPLSAPVIELSPGSAGAPRLAAGDTIPGTPAVGAEALIAGIQDLRADLDSLLRVSARIGARAGGRQAEARRLGANAARLRTELDELASAAAAGSLARFAADPAWGRSLESAAANVDGIAAAARDRLATLDTVAGAGGAEARRGAQRLRALAARLERLRGTLAVPHGTLGRLATDSALTLALDSVRVAIDSLVADAKKNPGRYVF